MIDPEALLLTYSEAGELLGFGRRTIARLITDGKIQAVGTGAGRRVTRESVARYCGVRRPEEAAK